MDNGVNELKQLAESGLVGAYKKTYFVMAENNFIRNPKYTVNQKMVYLTLASYAGVVGSCYPSQGTLSKDLNLSVNTVKTVLKQLEELGAIIIVNQVTEINRKTSNLYILAEIDKQTGEFIPESIKQFEELAKEPIKIKGM